jgi:acyl-[acyl-carrier-protein]-phospholipid O-acyltransferase/long-chain-fatty-acid--[acyl-carrier-protein] ligase
MDVSLNGHRSGLLHDRSFWGLNLTQFLGAFNDNLFKQLVMLLCLDEVASGRTDLQGWALILFAVPFIALSGYAGFLSDRYSKRTIIVICKVAEVGIVLLGMAGFLSGSLSLLLAVLCLMGCHSAFFGPSKYGILPEMLRTEDLPRANGMMLMATFLAIIFGLSAAGFAKQTFNQTLWMASLPCLVISIAGLISSLVIQQTPIAQPSLKFEVSSLIVPRDTRILLLANRQLLGVLLMSSVFWFLGGTIYPPAINALSKEQFHFDDLITGILAASTGVGIAIGCVVAGVLSKDRVRGWIVRTGAWGITVSLLVLALPGPGWQAVRNELKESKRVNSSQSSRNSSESTSKQQPDSSHLDKAPTASAAPESPASDVAVHPFYRGTLLGPYGSAVALIAVGLFAGFYSVPLQVYLQSTAPSEQKGRIIGAVNLMNWIGIAGAGVVYSIGRFVLVDWLMFPYATLFAFASALMLPVALFYRPPEAQVSA